MQKNEGSLVDLGQSRKVSRKIPLNRNVGSHGRKLTSYNKKKVIFFHIKKKIYTLPLFLFYEKSQLLVRPEDPLNLHY